MAQGFEGFGGFAFERPADVQAEFQAGLQQALTSGNPDQMRAAIMQQAANNIAKPRRLREAEKRENLIAAAMQDAENDATGDEILDQLNYFEAVQKAAVDAGLPDIAMQATAQMGNLRLVQEERGRLKAQEQREVDREADRKELFKETIAAERLNNRHKTNGLLINPETLQVMGRYNILDENDVLEMAKLKDQHPEFVFRTEDQYVELSEAEKDRKARINNLNDLAGRSTLNKDFFKKTQATDAFAISSYDFSELLVHDDAATIFAGGGEARGLIERAGAHARSFFAGDSAPDDWVSVEDQVQRVVDGDKELGRQWNTLSSEKKALVMELGYALATSREGGRLTDQDVERAIISLGLDNPDPAAVAWIFGRAVKRTREAYDRSLKTSGVSDRKDVREAHAMVMEQLDETLDLLESRYKIDFDDEDYFDKLTDPEGAFRRSRSDKGTDVSELDEEPTEVVEVPMGFGN